MDALIAVLIVAGLWFAFKPIGWWRWFWLGLAVYLGVWEGAAVLLTHQTLSQQFWAASLLHPHRAWLAAGLVAAGGIGLGAHLMWKLWKKMWR